jgi:hypothetical protein
MRNLVLQTLFAGAGWTEFLAFQRLHPWPIWAVGSLCQLTRRLQAWAQGMVDASNHPISGTWCPVTLASNEQTGWAGTSDKVKCFAEGVGQ